MSLDITIRERKEFRCPDPICEALHNAFDCGNRGIDWLQQPAEEDDHETNL